MKLSAISSYPIKSCAGLDLSSAVLERRGLQHDRRWMLIDVDGVFITGRQQPALVLVQISVRGGTLLQLDAPEMPSLQLTRADSGIVQVRVWEDELQATLAEPAAHRWFSDYLGQDCRLVFMNEQQYRPVEAAHALPGDSLSFADGYPLLLLNEASLGDLETRVGRAMDVRRFRPNLLVSGASAYAEDHWRRIAIGELEFRVVKPCSRCAFTTVDPVTGIREPDGEPLRSLSAYRRSDHGVCFGQNLIPLSTGTLRRGDPLLVLETD